MNSLWPRTTIATAAVEVYFPQALASSRKPEIMADAAYVILTRDSRTTTGNFFIDEEVLRGAGAHRFLERYAVTPGAPLEPGHLSRLSAASGACRRAWQAFPTDREPVLRVVPMPADANPTGDIFGGWIMSQVDIAGQHPGVCGWPRAASRRWR